MVHYTKWFIYDFIFFTCNIFTRIIISYANYFQNKNLLLINNKNYPLNS